MLTDQHGNTLSGATAEAAHHFDRANDAFNVYRGDPLGLLERATDTAPEFTMAYVFKAHIHALATEPKATTEARVIIEKARTMPQNEREVSHLAALGLVLDGNWTMAAQALDRHNARYPRDLLALQSGHLMDFFRANARSLRDRIARVLPMWSPEIPGYSILLGMYAFGLEECGNYPRAEDEGRRAVAMQPLDCWAHHAVAHVMEMQGLHGARHIANAFGGSHAQRDVIDWTLTEAAVRGGFGDLAEALANERLALKPHSPVNRDFLSRACNGLVTSRQVA